MLKLLKLIKTPVFIAVVLVFSFILGWQISFGKEEANPQDISSSQESFSAALKDYYIGEGDLKSALVLYRELQSNLNSK